MKEQNPIIYIARCGCELDNQDQLKRIRLPGGSNATICKEHGGKVIKRKRMCVTCDDYFFLSPYGPGGKFCKPCGKKRKALLRKQNYKKYTKKPTPKLNGWIVEIRGDYCTGLKSCEIKGALVCVTCKLFVPIFRGIDPARIGCYAQKCPNRS